MLFDQNARRQTLGVVVRQHRHARLRDNRSGVELRHDEMDGAAMLGEAGRERSLMRMHAAQLGQQRGMIVEHAPAPALDEGAGRAPA